MKTHLLHTVGERARRTLRQLLSPTFAIILLAATLLWYTSKLNREYSTELELGIRIEGQKYRLTTVVSGRGTEILARKLSLKKSPDFTLEELSARPSRKNVGAYTFAPASLQNAIRERIGDDLIIVSVTDAPEFVPQSPERKRDKKENSSDSNGRESRGAKRSARGDGDKAANKKASAK